MIGADGKDLATATTSRKPANTWIPITWTQPSNTQAMILRLRVASEDGSATKVELIPWSVTVDHETSTSRLTRPRSRQVKRRSSSHPREDRRGLKKTISS